MTNDRQEQPEWMKPGYFENRPWQERLEEYGDLHGENCSCMMEDPDECDCEKMAQIKDFIQKELDKKDSIIQTQQEQIDRLRAALVLARPYIEFLICRNPQHEEPHKVIRAIDEALHEKEKPKEKSGFYCKEDNCDGDH